MGPFKNPILGEGFYIYFFNRKVLDTYKIYVFIVALVLVAAWPMYAITHFVRTSGLPMTFNIVIISVFIAMVYLSGRFSTDRNVRDELYNIQELFDLTPVTVGKVLWGRMSFSFFHTFFLILLPLPFIFISISPSGLAVRSVVYSVIVLLFCCFTYRTIGFFLMLILEDHSFIMNLILWFILFQFSTGIIAMVPQASPILAFFSISRTTIGEFLFNDIQFVGTTVEYFIKPVLIHLFIALFFILLSWGKLVLLYRESQLRREEIGKV